MRRRFLTTTAVLDIAALAVAVLVGLAFVPDFGEGVEAIRVFPIFGAMFGGAVVGSYVSDRGNVLEIKRAGETLRFWLRWSPPRGPVTRGFVGRAGKSKTAALFNDGSKAYEVEIKRKGRKPVEALSWSGTWYRRQAE